MKYQAHNPKVTGSSPVPATKLKSRIINGLKSSNRFFMLNFKTLIQQEYKSAYESAYDLSLKKQFSDPKIYTANGDLSKRWYVYFSYRDPKTYRLKRQTPFYGTAHTYKTKEERIAVLSVYRQTILKYLKKGYSPYEDNTAKYQNVSETEPSKKTIMLDNSKPLEQKEQLGPVINGKTINEAISFDLMLKKKTLQESSLRSYKSHVNVFGDWLQGNYAQMIYINAVDKKVVNEFLNYLLEGTSARNRNNYRASISSLFQSLEDNDIIASNFIKKIKVLKSNPKRNKRYSKEQQEQIFNYLAENDKLLLLYIKFVAYNFLRPIEVCRLKIGDIDIKSGTVSFKAKNSPMKTKIIPEVLLKSLPDLSALKKDHLLFTPNGIGQEWNSKLESRRGYFTKRFAKIVKPKFGLDLDHTLYSFRHTFITKLYRELVKDSSPYVAKGKLMQITGHSSMKALEKYLRSIDAELPEDYSNMLMK